MHNGSIAVRQHEHYRDIGLIAWEEDVKGRLEYYVGLLSARKPAFEVFSKSYGFVLAIRLLARFPAWQTT